MTRWLVLLAVAAIAIWWYAAPQSTRNSRSSLARSDAIACAPPTHIAIGDGAVQSDLASPMPPFAVPAGSLQPLAGFSINARVLSRKRYDKGREASFSPIDLALGWGRMRDDDVLSELSIDQSSRWYHYRWEGHPPIPPVEIARSSANMHMIPSSDMVNRALDAIEIGDHVRIDGWLVQANAPDGWNWRSSLTREDTGAGACEVIYVCAVNRQTTR